MAEKSNYFVLRAKAVPEVLLKVVEAKRLLDSGKLESVQEATDAVGISRSSFYKYKDVFPESDDVDDMAKQIESLKGIHYVKILARE